MSKCIQKYGKMLVLLILAATISLPAAAKAAETTTLRVISTTDNHEQLADEYYDIAGEHKTGSLAQTFTLLKEARAEITTGTSVTVDCGDTIYGYSGHYLATNYRNRLNSMFKAFGEMDYDCITMGNHDFDTGVDYLLEQLDLADLMDITVCANVYDALTKKPIWNQNMLIEKKVTTSKGRTIKLKIGFVGVTRPQLSNFTSHKGILTTTDILAETKIQAKTLKEDGADIIIAVAHSGIGTDSPDELSTDTCYAISQLKDIDVVMGGHIHVNFPSSSSNVQKYYELPNVDQETGLMNGKSVIIVADRGVGIGVADLKLRITKTGKIKIDNRSSEIRYTTRETPYDEAIMQYEPEFDGILKATYKERIVPLAEGESMNNFFATIQDNPAMQLVNEAKIQYGMDYLSQNDSAEAYRNYPVIAVSAFMNAGAESGTDYLNASGEINMGDLLRMQSYGGNYATMYTITGNQLREWLEWTASAYQQPGTVDATYEDDFIMYNQDFYTPLLQSRWSMDWRHFYTFDGVEYDIDISQPARYDYYGSQISEGKRISRLTCNGVPVTDTQNFFLVSDMMTQNPIIGGVWTTQCKIERTSMMSYQLLINYLKDMSAFGGISPRADNNWRLIAPASETYLVKSGIASLDIAKTQSWYKDTLMTTNQYAYYSANLNTTDIAGPTLVLNQEIKIATHRDVPIRIQATDVSGIESCKYLKGKYDSNAPEWKDAHVITNNVFQADTNSIYSVMATDTKGNKTIRYIDVNVIDRNILQVPSVDKLNNRINEVTGVSATDSWVFLKTASGDTYYGFAGANEKYSIKIPYLDGESEVTMYAQGLDGRRSANLKLTVKRTGSNYPFVHKITNTTTEVTGKLNDNNCMMVAEVDGIVYVPKKGGREAYLGCNNYDSLFSIVEVPYSTAGGSFTLEIPVKATGKSIDLYSIDYIGRVSAKQTKIVEEDAPNKPTVYEVSDADGFVYGRSKTSVGEAEVCVKVAGKTYKGKTDAEGYFAVLVSGLKAGKMIKVQAEDKVDGKKRSSAVTQVSVINYQNYVEETPYQNITMRNLTNKSTEITGKVMPDDEQALYIRIGDEEAYEVPFDEKGNYRLELKKSIKAGTIIYATMRYVNDDIDEIIRQEVKLAKPDEPSYVDDITNQTAKVGVISEKNCTVTVQIGKRVYQQSKGVYKKKYDGYLYKVKIYIPKKHQKVKIWSKNAAGKSPEIKTEVIKA